MLNKQAPFDNREQAFFLQYIYTTLAKVLHQSSQSSLLCQNRAYKARFHSALWQARVPWPGTIFPSFSERNICQISQLCQTTRAARMTYSFEVMINCGSDGKRTAHTLKHTRHLTIPRLILATPLALKPTRSALRSQ